MCSVRPRRERPGRLIPTRWTAGRSAGYRIAPSMAIIDSASTWQAAGNRRHELWP
jgi:hypothetical protein